MRKHITALAILMLPALALAGGYTVPNYSPRDLAMCGSLVAAQNGAGAVYVNPAALAGLDGLNLSVAESLIDLRSDWTASQGQVVPAQPDGSTGARSASMYPKAVFPPNIYLSYSGEVSGHRYGLGAGFNIPGGGNVFWKNDWPGRFDIISVDRKVYAGYLTGGVQVVPGLKLGGGLIYYRTTEVLDRSIDFLNGEGYGRLGTAGDAWSYDVSAEWTPLKDLPLTLALDYKHKGDQKLTGKATFRNVPAALSGVAADQNVTHYLSFPNLLQLGVSYRVIPELLITGHYSFERFVLYNSDMFVGDQGTTIEVKRSWGNGQVFRLGAEWTTPVEGLKARVGVLRDLAPSDAGHYSPTLPDADVWGFSVGAGYAFLPGWTVDAAFFRAQFDTVDASKSVSFPGTYKDSANVYSIGVSWHVPTGAQASANQGLTAAGLLR
ncbi:MAG TPA: outer membrane protein transport protein [Anaeromyxobacteraceae bacterium]|jgi:long-chain fatty acid transport protein|nr:outer membrane protein transport protein [Anaeromyxobacteraceae bacterium]